MNDAPLPRRVVLYDALHRNKYYRAKYFLLTGGIISRGDSRYASTLAVTRTYLLTNKIGMG